jgi:nicotinamidase/pyrazinamidase
VDIDTQADFALPTGALYAPGAEELIPIWKRLTDFGEANLLPMVATMDCHRTNDPEFGQYPPHCIAGTPGHCKIPETLAGNYQIISPNERDTTIDFRSQIILEKNTLDVFTNVQAEQVFAAVACSTFAVYGLITEYCVRIAVLGLLMRGYKVHVVSDAIRPFDPAAGERALAEMANAGAGFIHSAAFFDKVRQHTANLGS